MKYLDLTERIGRNGRMSDLAFLEKEISTWLKSDARNIQIESEAYYEGKQEILQRKRMVIDKDGALVENTKLPNNKIIDNQFSIHVDKKTNYFAGKPLTVTSENDEFNKRLKLIFGAKAMRQFLAAAHGAITEGKHWIYVYIKDDELCFTAFPAYEILPQWADAAHTELDCAVRYYEVKEYDENGNEKTVKKVEVFDGNGIHRFLWDNSLTRDSDTPTEPYFTITDGETDQGYNWDRIPLVPFKRNRSERPILCDAKCLQDAYNLLLSDYVNDMESSPMNTIIVIKNAMGEDLGTLIHNLNMYRAIKTGANMQGVESGVDSLEINVNAENYKLILEALRKSIIENMRSYDAKDERLSGQPNQMNIQSVYSEIDIDANGMETEFQASFEDLMWFVKQHISNTGGGDYRDEPVTVIFNRDILINESETIENCIKSLDVLSEESVVEQHPWVKDVQTELDRKKAEQEEAKKNADVYNNAFGNTPAAGGVTGNGEEE